MLELTFGPVAAHHVRFAISPAEEVVAAVRAAAVPTRRTEHLAWSGPSRATLAELDVPALVATVTGDDYFPDFLTPPPTGSDTTLAEQVERLRQTSPDQVGIELGLAFAGRRPPPQLPGDPAAARDLLAEQMSACWRGLLEPIRPRVADVLAADIDYRAQRYATGGLAKVFSDLHPAVRHRPDAVVVASRHHDRLRLDERGLLLVPRALGWVGVGAMMLAPWPPALVYPARGAATLWEPRALPSAALAGVIGATKTRLLFELAEPSTTSALARRLALSPSTVSAHLHDLRAAGWLASRRTGRTVRYGVTDRGRAVAGR